MDQKEVNGVREHVPTGQARVRFVWPISVPLCGWHLRHSQRILLEPETLCFGLTPQMKAHEIQTKERCNHWPI
jgi:hypothetical protein